MADYIDRGKLLEDLERFAPECRAAFLIIEKQEAVDAVLVAHGRWIDRENPQWKAYDIRHCSKCGWNIPKTKLRNKDSHWNYCPNCGALMDLEVE